MSQGENEDMKTGATLLTLMLSLTMAAKTRSAKISDLWKTGGLFDVALNNSTFIVDTLLTQENQVANKKRINELEKRLVSTSEPIGESFDELSQRTENLKSLHAGKQASLNGFLYAQGYHNRLISSINLGSFSTVNLLLDYVNTFKYGFKDIFNVYINEFKKNNNLNSANDIDEFMAFIKQKNIQFVGDDIAHTNMTKSGEGLLKNYGTNNPYNIIDLLDAPKKIKLEVASLQEEVDELDKKFNAIKTKFNVIKNQFLRPNNTERFNEKYGQNIKEFFSKHDAMFQEYQLLKKLVSDIKNDYQLLKILYSPSEQEKEIQKALNNVIKNTPGFNNTDANELKVFVEKGIKNSLKGHVGAISSWVESSISLADKKVANLESKYMGETQSPAKGILQDLIGDPNKSDDKNTLTAFQKAVTKLNASLSDNSDTPLYQIKNDILELHNNIDTFISETKEKQRNYQQAKKKAFNDRDGIYDLMDKKYVFALINGISTAWEVVCDAIKSLSPFDSTIKSSTDVIKSIGEQGYTRLSMFHNLKQATQEPQTEANTNHVVKAK